jgi:alkanesulfonate monooxygenase SsuD/methylene tetrahydromethanopterin reductase-like flavin-dependent oxidoreductase (luciferase family)
VWTSQPVGGGPNPAVTPGAREIPLMFGGTARASFERVARWGAGYVGGPVPAAKVAVAFEAARAAWAKAGRPGLPYLAAVAHFALGDTEQGRANVWDYYRITGDKGARLLAEVMAAGPGQVKDTVTAFADIGADELIFLPTVGDLEDIIRLRCHRPVSQENPKSLSRTDAWLRACPHISLGRVLARSAPPTGQVYLPWTRPRPRPGGACRA